MPRLRHLKNYDNLRNNETNGTTGNSWLSNTAILRSIPIEKLLEMEHTYKTNLSLISTELRLRANGVQSNVVPIGDGNDGYGRGSRGYNAYTPYLPRQHKSSTKPKSLIPREAAKIAKLLAKAGVTLEFIKELWNI